jgi:hypothetical protein
MCAAHIRNKDCQDESQTTRRRQRSPSAPTGIDLNWTGTDDGRFTEKGGSAFRTKIGLGMFRGLVRHCEGGASKYCNRIETAEFRKSGPPDARKFESHPRAAAAAAAGLGRLAATETPSAAPGTPKVPGIYMGSTRSSTGASAPGPRVSRGSSHNNAAACQTPGLRGYQVPEDSE